MICSNFYREEEGEEGEEGGDGGNKPFKHRSPHVIG